jgi:alpha-L-rhamnosidase
MKWIGFITDKQYNFADKFQDYGIPPAYIVKKFSLKSVKKIRIKIAALGVYSLYVNNHLVNDEFMSQDLSEYDKTIYYRIYDISKYAVQGINSIGIILCDGWYSSRLSLRGRNAFGEYPNKVCFEITSNGEIVCSSDGSEKAKDGSIRAADNQNGIIVDNNYDLGAFSDPTYDISAWNTVSVFEIFSKIKKSIIKPIVKQKVFKSKLINTFDNHYIFDFSQNMAGVEHLLIKGKKGTKIIINHGEFLDNGKLYTNNLRSALARSTYILKGDCVEEFLPRHVYFGFRFIDLIIEGEAEIISLEAYAIWSKLKRIGYIKTNNRLVNKLYSNVLWGQRSNFLSIPTDCPQRDERMGWLGDAQVFSMTASYNYDVLNFYKKFIKDICNSMDLYKGFVPTFSPYFFKNYGGSLSNSDSEWRANAQGWSDAIIIIPYNLYLFYGDRTILKQALPYMKKYMNYVYKNHVTDDLYHGFSFGDWLSIDETTDKDLYNNVFLAHDNYLMFKICKLLNDKEQTMFLNNFNNIKNAFRKRFLLENKRLASDTQGAYILSLAFDLLSEEEVKPNLLRKINEYNHLTTGFQSSKYLLPILCSIGHKDIAYQLLNNKEYPSWGYMISCGATTIWERWDSYKKGDSFNKDGMNSFNHFSLGTVAEWMYSHMVGVKPTFNDPGFKKAVISPYFDKKTSDLSSKLITKYGTILVHYKIIDNVIEYHIKGDSRIQFVFDFNNKVIEQNHLADNEYLFKLEY